jgi:hypothetical protein
MYNDLDRFQKYILDLSEQNKRLSIKINKYTNNNKINSILNKIKKNNDLKNISGEAGDDIKNTLDIKTIVNNNYDDISQNNFSSLNFETLFKSSNNANINDNDENKKYNGLSDNEKETQNNEKKRDNIKNFQKLKKNKNNTVLEEKKPDFYFEYDSKDPEELSD